MSTSVKLYQASGRVGAASIVRVLLVGIPIALICAAIYAVVIRYNPFIYFSFLATIVFGLALGITALSTAQAGKSRSMPFNLAAALLTAFVGLWAHWLFWLSLHDGGTRMAIGLASQGPQGWGQFLSQLAENYHLSIGRARRSSSAEMDSGSMLWLWRVEALAVMLLALLSAWATGRENVFCESTGKWAQKEGQLALDAGDVQPATVLEAADRSDYALLASLPIAMLPLAGERKRIFLATLTSEPNSQDGRWFAIESAEDTLDDKGKLKRVTKPLAATRYVTHEVYSALAGRLPAKTTEAAVEDVDGEPPQPATIPD